MSVRLNIGLSRKVGEPNFGSRGASIQLEVELDNGVLSDPATMRSHVQGLYALARQSVDDELRRPMDRDPLASATAESQRRAPNCGAVAGRAINGQAYAHLHDADSGKMIGCVDQAEPNEGASTNGRDNGTNSDSDDGHSAVSLAAEPDMHSKPSSTNGSPHGHTNRISVARATPSQVRAIFALTRRQGLDPHNVISERFRVHRMEDLTIREASAVIDELNRGVGVRS